MWPLLQVRVAAALARIAAQPEQKLPDKQARLSSWMARLVAKQKESGKRLPIACPTLIGNPPKKYLMECLAA